MRKGSILNKIRMNIEKTENIRFYYICKKLTEILNILLDLYFAVHYNLITNGGPDTNLYIR
jgi:hypothetical protein